MHSATSSEGSGSIRIVGPYAQTRVTIEMHSQTKGAKRGVLERTDGLFFVIPLIVQSFKQSENITISHIA